MALIRPFVPAKEFETSKAFYQAIGFTLGYHDNDLAILDYEGAGVLLQNFYVQAFAENSMHQLFVRRVDEWWTRTAGLTDRFDIRIPCPPDDKEWGLRVGMLFDPSGVLWQVSEETGATP